MKTYLLQPCCLHIALQVPLHLLRPLVPLGSGPSPSPPRLRAKSCKRAILLSLQAPFMYPAIDNTSLKRVAQSALHPAGEEFRRCAVEVCDDL